MDLGQPVVLERFDPIILIILLFKVFLYADLNMTYSEEDLKMRSHNRTGSLWKIADDYQQ